MNEKATETYNKIHRNINFTKDILPEETKQIEAKEHFLDLIKRRGMQLPRGYN